MRGMSNLLSELEEGHERNTTLSKNHKPSNPTKSCMHSWACLRGLTHNSWSHDICAAPIIQASSATCTFPYWTIYMIQNLLPQLSIQGVFLGEMMCFRCELINSAFWGISLALAELFSSIMVSCVQEIGGTEHIKLYATRRKNYNFSELWDKQKVKSCQR